MKCDSENYVMEEKKVKELAQRLLELCVVISKDAHIFLKENKDKRVMGHYEYPQNSLEYLIQNSDLGDLKETCGYLKYNVPKYTMAEMPKTKTNYNAIFNGYQDEKIDITKYDGYISLRDWINNDSDLILLFNKQSDSKDCEFTLKILVTEIVSRYLFVTNADEKIPCDIEDKLEIFVKEAVLYYVSKYLYIDICVPICLVTFNQDRIKLTDNIEIVKIPEDIQKARQVACSYEVLNEDWAAACATHMIVFYGYYLENSEDFSINALTQDYRQYPLNEIDKIISIIRLVTGYSLGYEQILSRPIGWIYDACADLPVLFGAKSHFLNADTINMFWMFRSIELISDEQCGEIQKLYNLFLANEKKLVFSLFRYNRCFLRDDIDDMTIDACIGLESLLAGGTKAEITYTISNRVPVVFSKELVDNYDATNCREIMKKIYNLRSKIVHGAEIKEKDKFVHINDTDMYLPYVAIEFLRCTLKFMIKNPEYLDTKKIDEYIDLMLYTNNK